MLDFYAHYETFSKLAKKYQPQGLDKMLSKYSERSRPVTEITDRYNKLSYSERRKSDTEIQDQYLKSQLKETVAERVKIMSRKIKIQKPGTGIKILSQTNYQPDFQYY